MIALCERVRAYAAERNEAIIPIAGSQYNAPPIMFALFGSQTQRLTLDLSADYRLALNGERVWLAYRRGDWNHRTPAVRSGLALMSELGRHMQSGFLSLRREDATFYFVQGRALMIASGSWDILSMHEQAPFEIGAFAIPMPERDHPVYGRHTLGRFSEAGQPASAAFGVTRASRHADVSLDFLRFIASRPGNQLFSDISNWLPAIVGVEPTERLKPFALNTEGYIAGFPPLYGADSRRVFNNHLHLLVARDGSPERYADAVDARMPDAILKDFRLAYARRERQWRRNDSILAALAMTAPGPDDPRIAELLEAMAEQQAAMLWIRSELEGIGTATRF